MRSAEKAKASHRIALYIRVSTEEQASNPEGSIKSQEQRLRSSVDLKNLEGNFGAVTDVFIDRAKSGKDTNRPQLQRLIQAIRQHDVSLVMVSELSRLSRSIKDFIGLWDLMRANGCEFQSLREQFDTTTAAGEMILFTIANIAQFERKQTSERISANFRARAERGLYNGGPVPLGYQLDPDKKGYLLVNKEEAPIVHEAFKALIREGSLSKAGWALNERGFRVPRRRQGGGKPRFGVFNPDNLWDVLTNKTYAGLRVFENNGETKTTRAVWEPLIDQVTFDKVQQILSANHRKLKPRTRGIRFPFLLSGVTVCGQCGDAMAGKSAHGNSGKVPYYEHGWATKRQAYLNKKIFACSPHRIQAKVFEPVVWDEIMRLLTDPQVSEAIISNAHKTHESQNPTVEMDKIRNKVVGIQDQIEALAEHLTKVPKGMSPAPIFAQMQRLDELKSATQKELSELEQKGFCADKPVALKEYREYLKAVRALANMADSAEDRTKIIKRLVARIEVLPGTFRLHYHVGKAHFFGGGVPELGSLAATAAGVHAPFDGKGLKSGVLDGTKKNLDVGSKTLTNGGRHRTRTCDLCRVKAAL